MNHRTWIEIDYKAFNHNVSQYKKAIGDKHLSLVIKANAYGHGLALIAKKAEEHPSVHSICIATINEALVARDAGFTKPILMPSVLVDDLQEAVRARVELAVYDEQILDELNSYGKAHNYIFPIHIKIDTGLSRLGIEPCNATTFLKKALSYSHIAIQGIYSHCAESQKEDRSFTLRQKDLFENVIKSIQNTGFKAPYIHFANSTATTTLDLPFCNLFRVGAGAFGLWANETTKQRTLERFPWFNLRPILTWKTKICAIRTISAGSSIGYDRTYVTNHDMTIGILPIGYYDGYDFRLFNCGSVSVEGMLAPIIGRISMNLCSINISHIPHIAVGAEVILIGAQAGIQAHELGKLAGNPNVREITTKINAEIPRILCRNSVNTQKQKMPTLSV